MLKIIQTIAFLGEVVVVDVMMMKVATSNILLVVVIRGVTQLLQIDKVPHEDNCHAR